MDMINLNFVIRLSQYRSVNASYYDRGKWKRYAYIVFKTLSKQK